MKTLISTLALGTTILFTSCHVSKDVSEPQFRDINNVRLVKMGLLQTTAGADLVYYNPNDFGIQLADAKGDLYVDNLFIGRFQLDDKVEVKKRSEFILPVSVRVDNISAINQRDFYKKKEATIRIEGIALVKKGGFSKEVPIRYERMQDIEKIKSLISKKSE